MFESGPHRVILDTLNIAHTVTLIVKVGGMPWSINRRNITYLFLDENIECLNDSHIHGSNLNISKSSNLGFYFVFTITFLSIIP